MTGHVFISHGSEDREEAQRLCALVEARGTTCWMAPRDIRPGLDYSEALQGAIESCAAFIVLVTETSNKSPYVRAETEMAFSNHKPIFPVRFADIKPAAGLALFLKIRHWTDAYGPGREQSCDRLATELAALTGAAAPAEAPAPAPEAPPASAPPAPPAAPASADDERLSAAIGPNADYFRRKWAEMDAKRRSWDWNWAACFASPYWCAYRKLWIPAVAVAVAFLLLSVVGTVEPRLSQATFLVSIAITFATGSFGNHLYRRRITALVADASLDKEALTTKGGVSVPAVWIGIGVTILFVLVSAAYTVQQMPGTPASPASSQESSAEPAPAPAEPATPTLDTAYLIGRWSDEGDCNRAYEFTSDGRFVGADGNAVEWRLEGNEVIITGPGGTASMRVQPIDRNTMTITGANGETSNPIRC